MLMGVTLPVSIPSTTTRAPEGKEVTFSEPLPVWAYRDALNQQAAIIVNTRIISLCITVPPKSFAKKCSPLLTGDPARNVTGRIESFRAKLRDSLTDVTCHTMADHYEDFCYRRRWVCWITSRQDTVETWRHRRWIR